MKTAMSNTQELNKKIFNLVSLIEKEYPELYPFLEEIPQTYSANNGEEIQMKELKDYYNTLEELLRHHIETH